jgi:hypothetical protein
MNGTLRQQPFLLDLAEYLLVRLRPHPRLRLPHLLPRLPLYPRLLLLLPSQVLLILLIQPPVIPAPS